MMLPVMSGYDVLVALRSHPATAAIPIVGISAKARPEDVDLASDLGVDAYITKPFRIAEVLGTIEAYLR
jgi:DNA-binding response OmpR family regulator